MGHRCEYKERIVAERGNIIRYVDAYYKCRKVDVIKEILETGEFYTRYIYYTNMSGYLVNFEGEMVSSYYYGSHVQQYEEFTKDLYIDTYNDFDLHNKQIIEDLHPELHYLLKKINKPIKTRVLFNLIRMYWNHPEIESLVSLGYYNLALNKSLFKLSLAKRKEVINYIKNNCLDKNVKLCDIQKSIKYGINYKDIPLFKECQFCKVADHFTYILKNKTPIAPYKDYLNMCVECGKDLNDKYWSEPKDFWQAHALIMQQVELLKNKKDERFSKLFAKIGDTIKNDQLIKGYSFYIPTKISDVRNQAKALSQCLITADYPTKVCKGKSVLIFIKRDNQPIATAEITYDKNILQFYADERDRGNCKPNDELQVCLTEYLENWNIKKPKLRWVV